MKTQKNSPVAARIAKLFLAVLAMTSVALPAHAAKFGIRVVDENDQAIVGAAVCIGLQGNYKQFAATFTDGQGKVMVDVPNVPLLVTVSKDRFTGMRTTEPARSFNLIKQVRLLEGVPGPRCRAGSSMAENTPTVPTIVVTDIAVYEKTGSTTLSPTVSGEPNQYRVSNNEEFEGAAWTKYDNQIAVGSTIGSVDCSITTLTVVTFSHGSYLMLGLPVRQAEQFKPAFHLLLSQSLHCSRFWLHPRPFVEYHPE